MLLQLPFMSNYYCDVVTGHTAYSKIAENKHFTFNPFYKQSLFPSSLAHLTMYKFAVV
jgi:hypothetical protein